MINPPPHTHTHVHSVRIQNCGAQSQLIQQQNTPTLWNSRHSGLRNTGQFLFSSSAVCRILCLSDRLMSAPFHTWICICSQAHYPGIANMNRSPLQSMLHVHDLSLQLSSGTLNLPHNVRVTFMHTHIRERVLSIVL